MCRVPQESITGRIANGWPAAICVPGLPGRENTRGEAMIYHNPLDNIMYRFNGEIVRATDLLEYVDYDIIQAEELLQNWVSRHPNDGYVMDANPLSVKVEAIPPDLERYNRNMHRKHQEARRVRR